MNYKSKLKKIDTFILDYDGVLTNGTVILMPDGDALRTANVKDGYAMQLAVKKGYKIAIISGGRSASMVSRFKALNIRDFFLGVESKLEVMADYMKSNGLKQEQVLYIGDDIPDLKAMKTAGVAACPADASEEVKSICDYISNKKGGEGCVREIIEQVLKIRGDWMNNDAFAW